MKKRVVCKDCGSTNVSVDAYAQWNEVTQRFDLLQTFDKGHFCHDCENACTIEWKEIEPGTKHTPGEWIFRLGINENLVYSESYGAICTIPHKGKAPEEHQANAIIIAEAPALLKGLRDLITWSKETALSLLKDEEILPRGLEKWEKLVEKLS